MRGGGRGEFRYNSSDALIAMPLLVLQSDPFLPGQVCVADEDFEAQEASVSACKLWVIACAIILFFSSGRVRIFGFRCWEGEQIANVGVARTRMKASPAIFFFLTGPRV